MRIGELQLQQDAPQGQLQPRHRELLQLLSDNLTRAADDRFGVTMVCTTSAVSASVSGHVHTPRAFSLSTYSSAN